MSSRPPVHKLVYTDNDHRYTLNGKRCVGVSSAAKIVPDSYTLERWDRRQVAIGLCLDPNLIENVAHELAGDPVNDKAINDIVDAAKTVAGAHRKADRGTQMHRALEVTLLDRPEKLLTAQQRADAAMLRATLDHYGLTPTEYVERIVCYPAQRVAGRFDAILKNRAGQLVLTDLKSGQNAVRYPQGTAVQLALYAHAPMIAAGHQEAGNGWNTVGNDLTVTTWETLPTQMQRDYAYVILAEPDAELGTLHTIDTAHGWHAARLALEIIEWRRMLGYGDGITCPVETLDPLAGWSATLRNVRSVEGLRALWKMAAERGELTDELRAAFTAHHATLTAPVA